MLTLSMVNLEKKKEKKKEEEGTFSQQTKWRGKRCFYNDPTVVNTSVFFKSYTKYNKSK